MKRGRGAGWWGNRLNCSQPGALSEIDREKGRRGKVGGAEGRKGGGREGRLCAGAFPARGLHWARRGKGRVGRKGSGVCPAARAGQLQCERVAARPLSGRFCRPRAPGLCPVGGWGRGEDREPEHAAAQHRESRRDEKDEGRRGGKREGERERKMPRSQFPAFRPIEKAPLAGGAETQNWSRPRNKGEGMLRKLTRYC